MSTPSNNNLVAGIRNSGGSGGGGATGPEPIAHWTMDNTSGGIGIGEYFTEGVAIGLEIVQFNNTNYVEGVAIGVEIVAFNDTNYTEGVAIGLEITDAYWT